MSIREGIDRHQGLAVAVALVAVLVAVVTAVTFSIGGDDAVAAPGAQLFYTVDDGKTWFADDAAKLAPFERDGQTAYRAHVFTTDGGKAKWVGYLSRYTPAGKAAVESHRKQGLTDLERLRLEAMGAADFVMDGVEVKLPRTQRWVKRGHPDAMAILLVKAPAGSDGRPHEVFP